jgi:hypothetical protein
MEPYLRSELVARDGERDCPLVAVLVQRHAVHGTDVLVPVGRVSERRGQLLGGENLSLSFVLRDRDGRELVEVGNDALQLDDVLGGDARDGDYGVVHEILPFGCGGSCVLLP